MSTCAIAAAAAAGHGTYTSQPETCKVLAELVRFTPTQFGTPTTENVWASGLHAQENDMSVKGHPDSNLPELLRMR
jgi:hypothetical protein